MARRLTHQRLLVPLFAVPAGAQQDAFQPKLDAAVSALDRYPRFKGLTPEHRELIAEFMAGNTLFIALHELSHAVTSQMQLPALDRKEEAADAFAVMELAKLAPALSDHVLEQAAKGWFVSDQRTQDNGNTVPYFDDHGIDRERAERIACLMVGAGGGKFQRLAAETKCRKSAGTAAAPSTRRRQRPGMRRSKPGCAARTSRRPRSTSSMVRLTPRARSSRSRRRFARWAFSRRSPRSSPTPMCGRPPSRSRWRAAAIRAPNGPRVHKLGICYELAADFGESPHLWRPALAQRDAKPRTR